MPSKQILENGQTGLKDKSPKTMSNLLNTVAEETGLAFPRMDGRIGTLREYGEVLLNDPYAWNAWQTALVNMVWKVYVNNLYWRNPWVDLTDKGTLELGETAEEVWIDLAFVENYTYEDTEMLLANTVPDVKSAFHSVNYQKRYRVTINRPMLEQAFQSFEGLGSFVERVRDTLFNSAQYDSFLTAKYLLARAIVDGKMHVVEVPQMNNQKDNIEEIAAIIRTTSNDLTFPDTAFNEAGVYNSTEREKQVLIQTTKFNGYMSVKVLANAFNMDEARFLGQQLLSNKFSFTDAEKKRLALLFEDDPYYKEISEDEAEALENVYAVHLDKDWFFILHKLFEFRTFENGYTLTENNYLHDWKVVSHSPFRNAVVYSIATPTVESVSVSPATATLPKGSDLQLTATVTTLGFAPKGVIWSITAGADAAGTTISADGKLHISANQTGTTITVKATSVFDSTKSGTATITVS